jgi:hypothetical protein
MEEGNRGSIDWRQFDQGRGRQLGQASSIKDVLVTIRWLKLFTFMTKRSEE